MFEGDRDPGATGLVDGALAGRGHDHRRGERQRHRRQAEQEGHRLGTVWRLVRGVATGSHGLLALFQDRYKDNAKKNGSEQPKEKKLRECHVPCTRSGWLQLSKVNAEC